MIVDEHNNKIFSSMRATPPHVAAIQTLLQARTHVDAPVTQAQFQALQNLYQQHVVLSQPLDKWADLLNTNKGKALIALLEENNPVDDMYGFALEHAAHDEFLNVMNILTVNNASQYGC